MEDLIFQRAKEIFGEKRFEEIMGELWLQCRALALRARGRRGLDIVLREWENRFRRDTEEGRVQNKAGRRRRVLRLSELFPEDTEPTWDAIQHRIKRKL